jgi:hypothetical protein
MLLDVYYAPSELIFSIFSLFIEWLFRMLPNRIGTAIVAAAFPAFFSSQAPATSVVDVELRLLVDTSGRVSP